MSLMLTLYQQIAAQVDVPSDPELDQGFFAPITLFVDVTDDMRISKEEMFGTVGAYLLSEMSAVRVC